MIPTLKEGISEIRQNMEGYIEMEIIKAQLCREYYIELVNQGFTKDEALELCKYYKP